MATCWDVFAAMAHVREHTGEQAGGLTVDEVLRVNALMSPEEADALLAVKRQRYPTLFDAAGAPITPPASAPGGQSGDAVQAMQSAEAALTGVHTAVADFDRQLLAAILHAHKTTDEGKRSLDRLAKEIEHAVASQPLDTALGARELQTFLVGKLKDIIAVVGEANDSAESKTELVSALTALYAAQGAQGEPRPPAPATPNAPDDPPMPVPDTGVEPYLDAFGADDPAPWGGDAPAPQPSAPAQQGVPMMPTMPSFGGGGIPAGGAVPGESPLAGLLQGLAREREPGASAFAPENEPAADEPRDQDPPEQSESDQDTTTVTLPDGQTVTAPTPRLARVIQSAVDGTPIAEAFAGQGITLPAPGSAVSAPVDPAQVIAGDIGMFTDRHALAIGDGKALLDGQLQHITNVAGPSFLGWQHPPVAPTAPAPPTTIETGGM